MLHKVRFAAPWSCCNGILKLTSIIYKVGLLSKDNIEQIPFAYKIYNSTKESDKKIAKGFKDTFCRQVSIEFVGVWWVPGCLLWLSDSHA